MMVLSGCSEYDIKPTEPDEVLVGVFQLECPPIGYEVWIEWEYSVLLACDASSAFLSDYDCDAQTNVCKRKIVDNETVEAKVDFCTCVVPEDDDVPADMKHSCCAFRGHAVGQPQDDTEAVDDVLGLAVVEGAVYDAVDLLEPASCHGLEPTLRVEWQEDYPGANLLEEEACPQDWVATTPGMDYELHIDPALSYLTLTTATDTVTATLEGGGAAETGPGEFLRALAWASDETLDGVAYTDWFFSFDQPLSLNVSNGTYSIPATSAQPFAGWGYIDGNLHELSAGNGTAVTGTIDSTNGTWDLDYSSSAGATSMSLHLEGDVVEP